MKKFLFLLVLLSATPALAESSSNCDDLIGSWQGDRFDYLAAAQRTATTTFYEGSGVYILFEYNDGNSTTYQRAYGRWSCEGSAFKITFRPNEPGVKTVVDNYEIIELNSSYFVYKAVDPDCEGISGDCGNITYEVIRIPTVELDHCTC